MGKNKLSVKIFTIFAAVLMIFSLVGPVLATTNETSSKFTNGLQAEFNKSDEVSFIVTFKDKVNTVKVAENAKLQAKSANLSSAETEVLQRTSIIQALEATANKAQKNVANYLASKSIDYKSFYITNAVVVTATEEVAKELATFPEVSKLIPNLEIELIEPESVVHTTDANLDSSVLWNVEMVNAPALWQEGINGEGVVIASLDSGAQWDHPALQSSYRGYNAADETVNHQGNFFDPYGGQTVPYDDNGHGTHTIGTMTGYVPVADTYIGVAPGAKWIAGKILEADGSGTTDKLLEAAEWVMAPNGNPALAPDLVNNSWGFPGVDPLEADEFFRDIIQNWRAAGIFPVFAAGNAVTGVVSPVPGSISMPAVYPEAFAVGAIDENKNLASFSLRGPSPYDEIKPEVSAPGVNIISAYPGDDYVQANGTSMAAPAVAGVVALLLQDVEDANLDAIEEALTSTAEALTNDEYQDSPNNGFGHGLVDSYLAWEALQEDSSPDPVEIDRLYGSLRYQTAIEISQNGWEDGSLAGGTVILARGDDFSDALAGVPLAHAIGSPILLTPSNRLLDEVVTEIDRLGAKEVILLGGEVALSKEVKSRLDKEKLVNKRLSGGNRFETAVAIAEAITGGQTDQVFLANGMVFPDALSAASSAAQLGIPILLTRTDSLPAVTEEALNSLNVKETYTVGGTAVITDGVFAELPSPTRLSGKNRYETNVAVLNEFGTDSKHMYVATGRQYADALTGATLAAKKGTSVALVHSRVPESVANYLVKNEINSLTIFGGNAAVSEEVEASLLELLHD